MSYDSEVLADNPISYWKLEELSGSVASDVRGVQDGTYSNPADITLGVAGLVASESSKAARFGGTNGAMLAGNGVSLQLTSGTIECFVKTSQAAPAGTYRGIFEKQQAYAMLLDNNHLIAYDWGASASRDSGVVLNDGAIHHVALTFQSGVVNGSQLYMDGQPAGAPFTMTVVNQTVGLIGAQNPSVYLSADMQKMAVYSTVLSPARILAHFTASKPLPPPSPKADIVIGQRNFGEIGAWSPINGTVVFNPIGCVIDRGTRAGSGYDLLYVYDSGHNRVLVYHWVDWATWNASTPTPFNILGQNNDPAGVAANGDSNFRTFPILPAATAQSLATVPIDSISPVESAGGSRMCVDSAGNLWLCDFYNHRVLRYPRGSATADVVIGQAGFTGVKPNRGNAACANNSLWFSWQNGNNNAFAAGVEVDSAGNVWVADSGNHRVLRFPASQIATPAAGGAQADIVIGQGGSFTAAGTGVGVAQMTSPTAVALSADRKTLYVPDPTNSRVMKYVSATAGFNPAVDTNLSGVAFGNPTVAWGRPFTVDRQPLQNQMWIIDTANNALYLLDEVTGNPVANTTISGGGVIGANEGSGGGIGIDSNNNVLFTNQRVGFNVAHVLNTDIGNATPGTRQAPNKVLDAIGTGGPSATGFNVLQSIAVGADQLIAADVGRCLFWNGLASLTNGKAADGYLTGITPGGNSSFTVLNPFLNDYYCMAVDGQKKYLWVCYSQTGALANADHRDGNNTGLVCGIAAFTLPLTSGQTPFMRITGPLPVLGGGSITPYQNWGICVNYDSTELWITQKMNNRTFRIRQPLTFPAATCLIDAVLGQSTIISTGANRGWARIGQGDWHGSADARVTTTATTLRDTRQGTINNNWAVNEFAGSTISVIAPAESGVVVATATIASNTADTITLTGAGWAGVPGQNNEFAIYTVAGVTTSTQAGPGGLVLDSAGNLYLSDCSLELAGNKRLLIYNKAVIPSNNGALILGPAATKVYPNTASWQPAVAPTGELVAGYNRYGPAPLAPGSVYQGAFPGIYQYPFGAKVVPDSFILDFSSSALDAVFDGAGNLYIGDHNKNLIHVYAHPFQPAAPPIVPIVPNPTPPPIPSPLPSPPVSAPLIRKIFRMISAPLHWHFIYWRADNNGTLIEDISDLIESGSIDMDTSRAVKKHLALKLKSSTRLSLINEHINVYATVDDGVTQETIALGLFHMDFPKAQHDAAYSQQAWDAYDRGIHLQQSQTTSTYLVLSNTSMISAVRSILASQGVTKINIPNVNVVASVDMTWPVGTPWLTIIIDLCEMSGMYAPWFDTQDFFTTRSYDNVDVTASAITYITDGTSIVLPNFSTDFDSSRFANQIVVVSDNPDIPISSIRANTDPASPTSISVLGYARTKTVTAKVPTQAVADARALLEMQFARAVYTKAVLHTTPDPTRGVRELYDLLLYRRSPNKYDRVIKAEPARPTMYLRFGDLNGVLQDSSGRGNNALPVGGSNLIFGQSGAVLKGEDDGAIKFNDSTMTVECANAVGLAADALLFEGWIYLPSWPITAFDVVSVAYGAGPAGQYGYKLTINTDATMTLRWSDGVTPFTGVASTASIPTKVWVHIGVAGQAGGMLYTIGGKFAGLPAVINLTAALKSSGLVRFGPAFPGVLLDEWVLYGRNLPAKNILDSDALTMFAAHVTAAALGSGLIANGKWWCLGWTMPLAPGADMSHTVARVDALP